MKKTVAIVAALCMSASTAALANDKNKVSGDSHFDRIDTNDDGVISRSEWTKMKEDRYSSNYTGDNSRPDPRRMGDAYYSPSAGNMGANRSNSAGDKGVSNRSDVGKDRDPMNMSENVPNSRY